MSAKPPGWVHPQRFIRGSPIGIPWRCQAKKTLRSMDGLVSVVCHKHFRHGLRKPGFFRSHHTAFFPDDDKLFPVRWHGNGEGTEEQQRAWELGTEVGMVSMDIHSRTPQEVIAIAERFLKTGAHIL